MHSVDGRFGNLVEGQEDGAYDGLVGMVQRGEIDFVSADLSFSLMRSRIVDHLHPIYYYHHRCSTTPEPV